MREKREKLKKKIKKDIIDIGVYSEKNTIVYHNCNVGWMQST